MFKIKPLISRDMDNNYVDTMSDLKERFIHNSQIAFSIVFIPILFVLLYRVYSFEWIPGAFFQLLVVALFCFLSFFGKKLPYKTRGLILVSFLAIIGTSGLLKFGIIGVGANFLVISILIGTIFFGTRTGVLLSIIFSALFVLLGFLVTQGYYVFDLNFQNYAVMLPSWAATIICFLGFSFIGSIGIGWFYESIEELLTILAKQKKELEQKGQELERLASTDTLTGLVNRRQFFITANNELSRYKRYQHEFSLMMLDIDFFKKVNDTYGHAAGDEILKEFSSHSLACVREQDTLGRIGGEEFALLLPDTNSENAKNLGERIRQTIENTVIQFNNREIPITVSIGITKALPTDESIEEIVKRADTATYQAKGKGRNRVEFNSGDVKSGS